MPYVVSANRLADGAVVYFGFDSSWSGQLKEAKVFAGKDEAEAQLSAARNDAGRNLIVDACLVEVAETETGVRAITLRESIRAQGPTIDFLPRARAFAHEADFTPRVPAAREVKAAPRIPRQQDPRERELENLAQGQ